MVFGLLTAHADMVGLFLAIGAEILGACGAPDTVFGHVLGSLS